jgi:hypothetical protein
MALRENTGKGGMPDKSRMQVWLFAACLLGGWHSAACAQNIDSIELTLRSRICPPETSRMSLVNGSCKPEADRLAAARSSESNPAYADLIACNRRETEQNRAILQYNQFMEACESSERSKQEAERKKAAEEARTKAQETKAAASKVSSSTQDLDKRLEQAKLKAETLGRKNQNQGRSLAAKAEEVAQAKFLEQMKRADEDRRRENQASKTTTEDWSGRTQRLACYGDYNGDGEYDGNGFRRCAHNCAGFGVVGARLRECERQCTVSYDQRSGQRFRFCFKVTSY